MSINIDKSLNIAPASINDYRLLAEKRLPRQLFDYIDGGSYQEKTLQENLNYFDNYQLKQKVLCNVSDIDTSTTLLNNTLSIPAILAPVGLAGCYAKRGEVQALSAATKQGIPFCLSTVSICSIEELHKTQQSFWFQLYIIKDRDYVLQLLNRAKKAGCKTLILTVDLAVLGERYRDIRNGLNTKKSIIGSLKRAADIATHPRWFWNVAINGQPLVFGNLTDAVPNAYALADFKAWVDNQFDASVTWQDLQWLRDHWQGNLVIKGIMDVEDAKQAAALGADAIVISNHGGRQLDGVPATLAVLPEIANALNKQCTIILDGGIRSGLDIIKAIALGADACMLGRAWAYALAAQGQQGVNNMLCTLKNELHIAMALTGKTTIAALSNDILSKKTTKDNQLIARQ
jgi:L-lactate dehydrogenase (cytochrome)